MCIRDSFLVEVSLADIGDLKEVRIILRYIGPALLDREAGRVTRLRSGHPTHVYLDERSDRWSIHHLMEVEGLLTWERCDGAWGWVWHRPQGGTPISGLRNLVPIGCLAARARDRENALVLRDHHIDIEVIHPLPPLDRGIEESFNIAIERVVERAGRERAELLISSSELRRACSVVAEALAWDGIRIRGIRNLYRFQEESLAEGLYALVTQRHKVIVLQARTAGGKTLAFLLPILAWIVARRYQQVGRKGVKAIFFYPTTALQNDQASVIFELLWRVNSILRTSGSGIVISLGLLHGY